MWLPPLGILSRQAKVGHESTDTQLFDEVKQIQGLPGQLLQRNFRGGPAQLGHDLSKQHVTRACAGEADSTVRPRPASIA